MSYLQDAPLMLLIQIRGLIWTYEIEHGRHVIRGLGQIAAFPSRRLQFHLALP